MVDMLTKVPSQRKKLVFVVHREYWRGESIKRIFSDENVIGLYTVLSVGPLQKALAVAFSVPVGAYGVLYFC